MLGAVLLDLRRADIRKYKDGEQQINNHYTLDNENSARFLKMSVMESSLRSPDCQACKSASMALAAEGRLGEQRRLGWQFWAKDAANAYKVTLHDPHQDITVRACYDNYAEMNFKPTWSNRRPEIRPYQPGERQTTWYGDLRGGNSDHYRMTCLNLSIWAAEASLRMANCEFCSAANATPRL